MAYTSSRRWLLLSIVTVTLMAFALTTYALEYSNTSLEQMPIVFPSTRPVPALPSDAHEQLQHYAYLQHVRNEVDLCSSLMIFASLQQVGAAAKFVLAYPERWVVDSKTILGALLRKARDQYGVMLSPVPLQEADLTWGISATRLLALGQISFERVLLLDLDSTVMLSLDELFFLPTAVLAQPYAYWKQDGLHFAPQMTLLQPSAEEHSRYLDALKTEGHAQHHEDIFEQLFAAERLVFEHRGNLMVTKEFSQNHASYLGNETEVWDPFKEFSNVKLVHFLDGDDEILAKPHIETTTAVASRFLPACANNTDTGGPRDDCSNQVAWQWIYGDYGFRRADVCGNVVL